MIKAQFVLGRGLSSKAIAYFGAGGYSHVDIVLSDGYLLGARSDRVGHRPPGVQIREPDYEIWDKQVVVSIPTTQEQAKAFYNFANAQVDKPYDSTAIWGIALGRDWRDPADWFCSELYCAGLEVALIVPQLCATTNKITPGAAMLISTAIGGRMEDMKKAA